jgi:hypothetical protein
VPEITLYAPFFFDRSIGYWTGEPDREAAARALAAVPQGPEVEREVTDTGVVLRGPEEAIREEARRLREAGLE